MEIVKLDIFIEVKKSINLNCKKSLFIEFKYDNFVFKFIRAQPKRFLNNETKEWELPYSEFDKLVTVLRDYNLFIKDGENDFMLYDNNKPNNYTFKTKPYKHQLDCFNYGLNNNAFFLGDEQGLGKTKQIIDIAVAKKQTSGYKHCLIISCVNGLCWNWKKEIETHSNEHGYILGTRVLKNKEIRIKGTDEKIEDLMQFEKNKLPYFIIVNIETIRNERFTQKLLSLLKNKQINMIAVDEIHKCKNPSSRQGRSLLKLDARTKIAMTGTPVLNNPLDLYIITRWLKVEDKAYYKFKQRYCVYSGDFIVGYKNLDEIQDKLKRVMLRRLKSETLDLPEKTYKTELLEMGFKQNRLYNRVSREEFCTVDGRKEEISPLIKLSRLRKVTSDTSLICENTKESVKLNRLLDIVDEQVQNGKKCIVFSNWEKVIRLASEKLNRYNHAIITGKIPENKRIIEQGRFMQDESCKVILGTIGALGTGFTLTEASVIIFLDSPWNKKVKAQAEDRAHRIGMKESLLVITLVCKDTIDEDIEDFLENKGILSDLIVDGLIKSGKEEEIKRLFIGKTR